MTWSRIALIIFLVFVVGGLVVQFYTAYIESEKGVDKHEILEAIAEQKQQMAHAQVSPPPKPVIAADVYQSDYSLKDNNGSMTATVTLKNRGQVTARRVRIFVRPFRNGALLATTDGIIDDDDPISQMGDWVTFPDLAPGASASEDYSFSTYSSKAGPGGNIGAKIEFISDQAEIDKLTQLQKKDNNW